MSITSRLSLFFLASLALVLLGFSATLYVLASHHLHAELDRQLDAAMHIMVASIEVHPQDVEWEPLEREVTLGRSSDLTSARWTLHDDEGHLVDHSSNLEGDSALSFPVDARDWRLMRRRLNAGHFEAEAIDQGQESLPRVIPRPIPSDRTALRRGFLITVGLSEAPIAATLSLLAIAMAVVSLTIWSLAAVSGHWLCQKALSPMSRMAEKARDLRRQPGSQELLEIPATGDELAGLGQAFNDLLTTLRESIETQRRFAGDASHQLRTPLTAILTAVDVAARHDRSPSEYQRVLSVVKRRGRDLQQVVETLLMLTRQEPSSSILSYERINLYAWCGERSDTWRDHVRFADIHWELGVSQLFVLTDPTILGQAFDNLLDNACKYSEPSSPIVVRVVSRDGSVTLSVEDRGVGLESEDVAKVFEPFFRSEKARWLGTPGVGLGLTIARRLMEWLGGRLEVESVLGQGSCFRIVLPAEPGQQSQDSKRSLESVPTVITESR